ncbi:outer membrane protein assembly factor BamA [Buchnera aphidicola]|uniref:outer membrane protein assembly factor BamA n=1 Tax=Buchnera aphidicola TaxID=9 RepID=UPI003463FCD2
MLIKNCIVAFFIFLSFNICANEIGVIEKIQFQGLKSITKDEALKNIPLNIGKTISDDDIQESINLLFQTGIFQDIQVFYSGKTVTFKVKERPIIADIIIEGNKTISTEILNKYLTQLGIKIGSIFNPFINHIFLKKLEDFYKDFGKYKANIQILTKISSSNAVYLKIIIQENLATKIKEIKIIGNRMFSDKKLISLFYLKSCNHCWNIWDNCIYYAKRFQQDVDNLRNFYLNQGYFYFHINEEKINFTQDKNNVNIVLNVSEGEQYKISKLFVHSDCFDHKKLIRDIIKIHKNELYSKEKINFSINMIKDILSNYGYINAQVNVYLEMNHSKKTIDLKFYIYKKKRYIVHNISFRGNVITQDITLRRAIKQKEGVWFNKHLVDLGKQSLEKTQYFSDIQILTNLISNESNQIDIIYVVKENQTGAINFSMGYGLDTGVNSQISFSQNNLFGSGNSIQAKIIKSSNQKYLDMIIEYPYFISNNIHLKSRLFYNDYKYNAQNISSSINNNSGIEANLGLFINDFHELNLGLGYTHNNIFQLVNKAKIQKYTKVSYEKYFKNVIENDITLHYSWIYDDLKYFYFPISGKKISISAKNTIFSSDNFFYKLMLDSTFFTPLNKDNTFLFLNHFYFGLTNFFNLEKLPFYEKFYANNINNIRGFKLNTIGPKNVDHWYDKNLCLGYKNNNSCESIESVGGNAMMIMNVECIFPMPWIDKEYSNYLRSSFFLDFGSIWNTSDNPTHPVNTDNLFNQNKFKNNIHFSSGIALRWLSPIGPLVFSYAHPFFLQKYHHYQIQPFQFNIGKVW